MAPRPNYISGCEGKRRLYVGNQPPPHPSTSHCRISISCHERKANGGFRVHVREVWEYFQSVSARMMQGTWMAWSHYRTCLIFSSFNVYHSPVENLKKAFIFVLHVWAFNTTALALQKYTNLPFIFLWWHWAYDPSPQKNHCQPQTQCHLSGKLGQSAVKPIWANNP